MSNFGKVLETKIGTRVIEKPRVSVIVPAYNCSEFIADSVASVFAQTYKDIELIVVNDGSNDTAELVTNLEPWSDRITYIHRENGGAGPARNSGIEVSRGEFLGFLDGDDLWHEEFLEKQLNVLVEKKCDLVYCDADLFGDVGHSGKLFSTHAPSSGPVTTESLISGVCNVILSGVLVKKAPVVKFGMFTEGLKMAFEDYELWFRLCKNGVKIDYSREVLVRYRVHGSNISGGSLKVAERGLVSMDYFRENFELSKGESEMIQLRENEIYVQFMTEKAKVHLAQHNYGQALKCVRAGLERAETTKLKLTERLLRISPAATRALFHAFRRNEFEKALRQNVGSL